MLFNVFNKKTKIQTPTYCNYFLNKSSDRNFENNYDCIIDNHYEKLLTKKFNIRDDFNSINSINFLKSKEKVFQQMFLDDSIPENNKENENETKIDRTESNNNKKLKYKIANNDINNNKIENDISSKTINIPDLNKFSFIN